MTLFTLGLTIGAIVGNLSTVMLLAICFAAKRRDTTALATSPSAERDYPARAPSSVA